MLLILVLGAVALVTVGLILLSANSSRGNIAATERVGEGASWGPEGAPVTILDYSDFGCSHCAAFAGGTGERLREEYEATGKVRFEFKHFIIGGPRTREAANASECAADQGKFWDYHDALFVRQASSADAFGKRLLKEYATQLGLDAQKFNACVDQGLHMETIARSESEGRAKGVQATPTFFVNGERIEGNQPYEVFKAAIDGALASSGQ
jgi:protein-disulfide isomerase